jgi:hypothetical protein
MEWKLRGKHVAENFRLFPGGKSERAQGLGFGISQSTFKMSVAHWFPDFTARRKVAAIPWQRQDPFT